MRLTEEGYSHDIVIAVQSTNGLLTAQTKARVNALTHLQKNSDFAELIAIHKRVVNLLKDAEASVQPVDPDLFEDASERTLFSTVSEVSKRVQDFVSRETFSEAASSLLSMKPASDAFFENVMVNDNNQAIRANRLQLCRMVRDTYHLVANFNLIQQ